jgi:hypothetical protein
VFLAFFLCSLAFADFWVGRGIIEACSRPKNVEEHLDSDTVKKNCRPKFETL